MQLFLSPTGYVTSLSVSPYFATLVGEDDLNFKFEITFSILQSEIFKKSLSKIIINVLNQNVVLNNEGKQEVKSSSNTQQVVDEDSGYFEIQNKILLKNYSQIYKARLKLNSVISTITIDLQSYVNKNALVDFKAGKKVDEISSLREFVSTLEESNEPISYANIDVSSSDVQRLNHRLISRFLIDPSEAAAKTLKIENPTISSIRSFYLTNALSSIQSQGMYYKSVKKVILKDKVYIKKQILVPKKLVQGELQFEFEVYENKKNIPIQRLKNKKVDVDKHIKVANLNNTIPFFEQSNNFLNIMQDGNLDSFSIKIKEINNAAYCTPYKEFFLDKNSAFSYSKRDYKSKIFSNKKQHFKNIPPVPENKISIYRCIFKESSTTYVNPFFKNVVVGKPLDLDPTGLIIESTPNSNSATLKIINPPEYARQFQVLRRQLFSGGGQTNFMVVNQFSNISEFVSIFVDSTVQHGQTYEYMIKYKTQFGSIKNSIYKIYKHLNSALSAAVYTEISTISVSKVRGSISVVFNIDTSVNLDKFQQTSDIFLNSSGLSPFFGFDLASYVSSGEKILYNKVDRVNLKTGNRETIDIQQKGGFGSEVKTFEDSLATQKIFSLDPIDPNTNYRYEVRTFIRNPSTLLKDKIDVKNSVNVGDSGKNKSYAYRPYKWHQPFTLQSGIILSSDEKNHATRNVLEDGEIGVTATYTLTNITKVFDTFDLTAQRIDANKIKVSWSINEDISEYDHFVIIKEVSRNRKFVGAVFSLDYIDILEPGEAGTIIYYIIPVLKDYSISTAVASNEVIIDPEELL